MHVAQACSLHYSDAMPTKRPVPPEYATWYSAPEAATYLGKSIRTVWYRIDNGDLNVVRLKGPLTLIDPASLEALKSGESLTEEQR